MGNEATISQEELDRLCGTLELLDGMSQVQHIWLVKNYTNNSIIGGRCFSYFQAQNLLQIAIKEHPTCKIAIVQYK